MFIASTFIWAQHVSMGEMAVRAGGTGTKEGVSHNTLWSKWCPLPSHVEEETVSTCPLDFHCSPQRSNIRHRVKKQYAEFSQCICSVSSFIKSIHDTRLTLQCCKMFFKLPPTTCERRRQKEKREQIMNYPAALWPWSEWCGHLRWGNPAVISCSL